MRACLFVIRVAFVAALGHGWSVPIWAQEVVVSNEIKDLLTRPAKLVVYHASISRALNVLQTSAGVPIVFSPDFIPDAKVVTCTCDTVSVATALDRILIGTGLKYQ